MKVSNVLIVIAISLAAVCGILMFDADCSDAADGQITKDGCIFEYDKNSAADDPAVTAKWDGVSSVVIIPSSVTITVPGENPGEPDVEKVCKVNVIAGAPDRSGNLTPGCFSFNNVITKVTIMDADSNGKSIELGTGAFMGGPINYKDKDPAHISALTEVYIGNSVNSIPAQCFMKTKLASVVIPGNIKTIGASAFESCKLLTAVELNEGLVTIDNYAFKTCIHIKKIVIPDTVTTIGNSVFDGGWGVVTDLSELTLGNKVNSIGYGAFMSCSFTKVNIPASLKEIPGITTGSWGSTSYWPLTLESMIVDPQHEKYMTAEDGSIVTKDGKTLVFIPFGTSGEFTVPDTVVTIGGVFNPVTKTKLTSFSLNKATTIPMSFLSGNKYLETVDLSSIEEIPNGVCDNCTSLKTVIFSDNLKSFGDGFNRTQIEYLEVPSTATMNSSAFYKANLGTVIFDENYDIIDGFLLCGSAEYIKFPSSGVIGEEAFEDIVFDGVTELTASNLYGCIWVAGESGTMYKVSNFSDPAADASVTYQIPESISIPVDLTLTGSLEIADGMTVSGTIVSTNNMVTFDKFGSVGSSTILSVNKGLLDIDVTDPVGMIVSEVSRVKDIGINGFTDNGASVVVDLNAYTQGVPDGLMLVQYSVYTEVDGEQFLNPFKVAAVDVAGDSTVIADVGERMLSCAVSYCYDFNGREYWTPVSETAVMMPAEFVQIDAPEGVSMTIGNDVIENGEFLAFGTYSVKFTVPEGTQYQLNGKLTSEIENFVYYGQDLVFTPVPAQA